MESVAVSGSFDNLQSPAVRFLQEAARHAPVHVCLWSDDIVREITGAAPKFPQQERQYFLEAVRHVHQVRIVNQLSSPDELPQLEGFHPGIWMVPESEDTSTKRLYCAAQGILYSVVQDASLAGFPMPVKPSALPSSKPKVLVTGCFDWFHSGHVRFFEETARLGDLYVVVGHDENVRLLKGEGHPLFSALERCYMVGSIRYVTQALISTGHGWMDAEPEIEAIRPDMYAFNEDGDKPEKRAFCESHGLKYMVLKRSPAAGLPRRESTQLRGF